MVNILLKEIFEISDDEDSLDGLTLEENITPTSNDNDKKYVNKCEFCGYEAQANKRYIALQLLKKHKEKHCTDLKCSKCGFNSNDRMVLRRHNRYQHEVMTNSTSPPHKRKKRLYEETPLEAEPINVAEHKNSGSEKMDIDENISEESIKDLSFKLEDMEIDTNEDDEIS